MRVQVSYSIFMFQNISTVRPECRDEGTRLNMSKKLLPITVFLILRWFCSGTGLWLDGLSQHAGYV